MSTKAVAEPKPATPAPKSFTPARSLVVQRKCACGGSAGASGECGDCHDNQFTIQRSASNHSPIGNVPPVVHNVLSSSGRPLDTDTRSFMENRFGHDFSAVRIHNDARAAESARALNAHAYTVGQDVVFGAGQYAPDSSRGRHLLAHELAHTVQQRGLQRYASDLRLSNGAESHYEAEADRAAALVNSTSINHAAAPLITHTPHSPIISREEATPGQTPPPTTAPVAAVAPPLRTWQELDANSSLRTFGITARQDQLGIVAFRVEEFKLPPSKGPVIKLWETRRAAQALEATIDFGSPTAKDPPKTGLWQSRDRTSELRESWLGKLGWTEANARDNWFQSGGMQIPAAQPFKPKVGTGAGTTCQMDHVVELQLGGTNSRENVQVLDPTENQQSGREIWDQVSSLAKNARETLPAPKPQYILLHFDKVTQTPEVTAPTSFAAAGAAAKCVEVEACALSKRVAPQPGKDASGRPLEIYAIKSAGASDNLQVQPAPETTDLTGDENRAPSQLISGMLLRKLKRPKAPGIETIEAVLDLTNLIGNSQKTRVPISATNDPGPITFQVNQQTRELKKTTPAAPALDFVFPYLSKGHLNLAYDATKGLTGKGTLTPSLPLLSKAPLNIEFGPGMLRVFYGATQKNLATPIPGLRITSATLGADILPEFKPAGQILFEAGPVGKPFLTGALDASIDPGGLVFQGKINAHIPNTDLAEGQALYKNGQWSGYVVVESTQIRFPGVVGGMVRVDFNPDGSIVPSGKVDLSVAGNPITVEAKYAAGKLVFKGSGTFKVPALNPITATVETDGHYVNFDGSAGITIKYLTGNVNVHYRTGKWSGDGTVDLNKPPAVGTVTVHLADTGAIYGEGKLSYQITPKLTAAIGVVLNKDHSIRVSGEILLATIQLFPRFPASKSRTRLFKTHFGVPILGLSLGPVGDIGLVLAIDPEVGVYYGIGPGEIRNAKITTEFNPLSDDPNIAFHAGGQLYIPFDAGFYISIPCSLTLSAFIASVSAGLDATADIGVRGAATLDAGIDYAMKRWAIAATAAVKVNPVLAFRLDGFLRATAGIAPFDKSAEKRWNLRSWEWGSAMEFGVEFPFKWASDQEFKTPSFSDIKFIYPENIDFKSLIGDAATKAA